jgi:hypothetical protein
MLLFEKKFSFFPFEMFASKRQKQQHQQWWQRDEKKNSKQILAIQNKFLHGDR